MEGGPRPLVVFYGAECEAYRPDNAFGCYWNALLQAFAGPGCVQDPGLSCACITLGVR